MIWGGRDPDRLEIFETNYGRDAGWFVERDGRPIAFLTECRTEQMFWDSYRIEPLTEDPSERESLLNSTELWDACRFVYRNRRFGRVAEFAFPGARVVQGPGRITMRGLYLAIGSPTLRERWLLWRRRR